MAQKQKVEKLRRPSKAAIRRRFEERVLTLYGGANPQTHKDLLLKSAGRYLWQGVQEQWYGFLLAYDHGPDALPIQEASPFVTRITHDMRALAIERRVLDPKDEVARQLDAWADDIEARPDGLFEDVYEQLVAMIGPQTHAASPSATYPFPPSVVDTVRRLVGRANATRP
jgi:hypothetical protein